MRSFAWFGLLGLAAACSLVNAPEDAKLGPGEQACSKAEDCTMLETTACGQVACQNGACVLLPANEGMNCDDGLFCTEMDKCTGGVCTGQGKACAGSDACHNGVCNEMTQTCDDVAGNDGAMCDDKNPCHDLGTCAGGVCSMGADKCAKLTNDCRDGVCMPGGCVTTPKNNGAPCDVANTCAISSCSNGKCLGTPVPMSDGASCDDGFWCTVDEVCNKGTCAPSGHSMCPPDEGCGKWACDESNKTCKPNAANEGMDCSFGSCMKDQKCAAGICSGPTTANIYFYDDFHDNSKGWTMPPPATPCPDMTAPCINDWTIGKARQSHGGTVLDVMSMQNFAPDPGEDHTPSTFDNGVAGVNLGGADANPMIAGSTGNADRFLHDFYYLVSPVINLAVPGQVQLSYYRWLDSDYGPFMNDTLDISSDGGLNWTVGVLFKNSPGVLINDSGWTIQTFDLTPYKSATVQIRFGYSVTDIGVYSVGSWNIDDVLISNTVCP